MPSIKAGGRHGSKMKIQSDVICLPMELLPSRSSAFLEMAECLLLRSSKWNSSFALLHTQLFFIYYAVFISSHYVSHFYLSHSTLHPSEKGCECEAVLCLVVWMLEVEPQQFHAENFYIQDVELVSGKLIFNSWKLVNCQWEEAEYLHIRLTSTREE